MRSCVGSALALATLFGGVVGIDTGRRCCVYQIERPENNWTYNFRTRGLALLRSTEQLLAVDLDGYVAITDYSGDYCYEWGKHVDGRAEETRPLGQRRFEGATVRQTDQSEVFILELAGDEGSLVPWVHLLKVSTMQVTASIEITTGPWDKITGYGGMTWMPDGTARGKFLFSLSDSTIAVYDIDLTASSSTATYVRTMTLPGTIDQGHGNLTGIFVNDNYLDDTNEIWSYFQTKDMWFAHDLSFDGSTVSAAPSMAGDMLSHRAEPKRTAALAIDFTPEGYIRMFNGNALKWIYELHIQRGKERPMECPWHMKNLQSCCFNQYKSSCVEETRDNCEDQGGTFTGAWKVWWKDIDLCAESTICGKDDIADPSVKPPPITVDPELVGVVDSSVAPTEPNGWDEKYYYVTLSSLDEADSLHLLEPNLTRTTSPLTYQGATSAAWSGLDVAGAFAATFSSQLYITTGGAYKFYISSDDGSRIYVDSNLVTNNDHQDDMANEVGEVNLEPGTHKIFITYYSKGGEAGMRFKFKGPDTLEKWDFGADYFQLGGPSNPMEQTTYDIEHASDSFEDFDNGFFYNRPDGDFNWTFEFRKQTYSLRTGPNGAKHGNEYAYAEVSDPRVLGDIAMMQSVPFLLGKGAFFTMWYSMYGRDIGGFKIDLLHEGGSETLLTLTGMQGVGWEQLFFNLTDYDDQDVSVLFTTIRGGGVEGDVAVDDFRLYLGQGARGQGPVPTVHLPLPSGAGWTGPVPEASGAATTTECDANDTDCWPEDSDFNEDADDYLSMMNPTTSGMLDTTTLMATSTTMAATTSSSLASTATTASSSMASTSTPALTTSTPQLTTKTEGAIPVPDEDFIEMSYPLDYYSTDLELFKVELISTMQISMVGMSIFLYPGSIIVQLVGNTTVLEELRTQDLTTIEVMGATPEVTNLYGERVPQNERAIATNGAPTSSSVALGALIAAVFVFTF